MAASIFVRELTSTEQAVIEDTMKNGIEYKEKRAKVIKYSSQGYTTTEIVEMVDIHSNNVRKWINRFNKIGLSILDHHNKGSKVNKVFTEDDIQKITSIALSRPRELGQKFTNWSIPKLTKYLIENKIVKKISTETVRTMLISKGISFQHTKAWLHSTDPNYQAKKEDILSLYNNPPKDGVVLCYDEKGSITVKEYQGSGWSIEQIKARMHYKIKGKTELLASYNPQTKEVVLMFEEEKKLNKPQNS